MIPGTNIVINPITGLASGLGKIYDKDSETITEYSISNRYPINRNYNEFYDEAEGILPHYYEYSSINP
jgi:hypothetical protein